MRGTITTVIVETKEGWKCDECHKVCPDDVEPIQEDGEQYDFCSYQCLRKFLRRNGWDN